MSIIPEKCKTASKIQKHVFSIPFGYLEMACCSRGLHLLRFKDVTREKCSNDGKTRVKAKKSTDIGLVNLETSSNNENMFNSVQECLEFLSAYFSKYTQNCSGYFSSSKVTSNFKNIHAPSICWTGICNANSFSEKVMRYLYENVEIGQTLS